MTSREQFHASWFTAALLSLPIIIVGSKALLG